MTAQLIQMELQALQERVERMEKILILKSRYASLEKRIDQMTVPEKVVRIVNAVSEQTGISRKQIMGRDRSEVIARARQIAMVLALEDEPGRTLLTVGRMFNRDHGTVIHAKRQISFMEQTDARFALTLSTLRKKLKK